MLALGAFQLTAASRESWIHELRHMKEYLEVLGPLLRGEPVKFEGDLYRVQGTLSVPGGPPLPLLIAALGDRMLAHAGGMSDGTITWMTGVKTLGDHIVPKIRAAAERAGRSAPRIVAGLPIALTKDVAAANEVMAKHLVSIGGIPTSIEDRIAWLKKRTAPIRA